MKWRWRKKRQQQGKPAHRPNLICGPVHTCWPRFARYFDVELRQVPCEGNRLLLTPEEVLKRCDENTIGVVPTLGVTYTLQYEPVLAIAMALDDFEEECGVDIPMHIDAASGGFVAPFLHPSIVWDFRIPRVRSINASGHKFGLSPLGCGWIVWRSRRDLPEELIFDVKYLGGHMRSFALNFSRPGGQVVAQYYNFVRLGKDGYTKIAKSCAAVGAWFTDELRKFEIFDLIYDGRGGLPGCTWCIKPGEYPRFDLYELADRLRAKGWQVPAYPMPPHRTDLVVQRMVTRLGVTRDLAGLLMDDIRQAVKFLSSRRARPSLGSDAAGGYNHT